MIRIIIDHISGVVVMLGIRSGLSILSTRDAIGAEAQTAWAPSQCYSIKLSQLAHHTLASIAVIGRWVRLGNFGMLKTGGGEKRSESNPRSAGLRRSVWGEESISLGLCRYASMYKIVLTATCGVWFTAS